MLTIEERDLAHKVVSRLSAIEEQLERVANALEQLVPKKPMQENKTIEMIPCNGKYNKELDSVPLEETDNAGYWYLHGQLAGITGHDKAVMTNCNTLGLLRETNQTYSNGKPCRKLHLNGVFDCRVMGVDEPCRGYFYTIDEGEKKWTQRGLVCLQSDISACNEYEIIMLLS